MKFKKEICLTAALFLSLTVQGIISTSEIKKNIENDVLRLHIPANSDSMEDQNVKIKVRDGILEKAKNENWFENCTDSENAAEKAENYIDEIEKTADNVLKENGFDYVSKAEVTKMHFDERNYEDYTFPSGEYTAVRITLGKGEGHNWWCVMYPNMCIPCAENVETDDEKADEFFSEKEKDVLKNPEKYRFKLKICELLEKFVK